MAVDNVWVFDTHTLVCDYAPRLAYMHLCLALPGLHYQCVTLTKVWCVWCVWCVRCVWCVQCSVCGACGVCGVFGVCGVVSWHLSELRGLASGCA